MKIRRNYVLTINSLLGIAVFSRNATFNELSEDSIVEIYYCNFSELKYNLKLLSNYLIIKRK